MITVNHVNNSTRTSREEIRQYQALLETYTKVYKNNDRARFTLNEISKKLAGELYSLPSLYGIRPWTINDFYKSPPELNELYTGKSGCDYVTSTYIDLQDHNKLTNDSTSVRNLIDFMEHLRISINIAEYNNNLGEKLKKHLTMAKDIHKDMHKKLLEICPKYKKQQDLLI